MLVLTDKASPGRWRSRPGRGRFYGDRLVRALMDGVAVACTGGYSVVVRRPGRFPGMGVHGDGLEWPLMGRVILDRQVLRDEVARLRAAGKSIVFANGAFDVIHVGHVRYLWGAAAEGDSVIVGVNSDESIRRYKSKDRPLQPLAERMEIVAAFAMVTAVTPFDEPTCDALLELIRPDVHAKGPDYTPRNLPEYPTLQRLGIRLANVGDPKDHSSSELIARMKA